MFLVSIRLNKFGLIGSHISHSRSPEIYKRIIKSPHSYELIDVLRIEDLPTENELKKSFNGMNITSPWKNFYAKYAKDEFKIFNAVNCLKITPERITAINTDVLALRDLIPQFISRYSPQQWVILGNGVMAKICQQLLVGFGQQSAIFSRPVYGDLSDLNLTNIGKSNQTKIVINACSRSFNYRGNIDGSWVFWDLNYLHSYHENVLPSVVKAYIDGSSLLEGQAQYAVTFWESQE